MKRGIYFAGVVGVALGAMAQNAPPPIKVGLWQTSATSTMTGLQIPPEVAARLQAMGRQVPGAEPRTTVTQSCATEEKWQKMFSDMQDQKDRKCALTNQKMSAEGMSADIVCKSSDDTHGSSGHIDVSYLSSEKMHGKVHIEATTERQPQPIKIDIVFDSVYQGSDCKGVSPDSARVVH